MDKEKEEKEKDGQKYKKKTNKQSLYLIGFYLGVINIADLALKYYLKAQKNISNKTFTIIKIIIKIAYLIKPLYGLMIDFVPIFGYKKKKFYLIICFLINFISWCVIILNYYNFILSIIFHFLINITISFISVISSAIKFEISRNQDKQNGVSEETKSIIDQYKIIETYGNLIFSLFKGFLIQNYSIYIIFYISGFLSIFILISGIILKEDKDNTKKKTQISRVHSRIDYTLIIEKKDSQTFNKFDKFKNIIFLLALIFILELTPTCDLPLFNYETNKLGLTPGDLGLIDCFSQVFIIIFIKMNEKYFSNFNFRTIIFFIRILIFWSFLLIYLLITKSTQAYLNDFVLITFSSALRAGLISLGKRTYVLLCIKYTPFGYEATIFAIFDCICNLGNLVAEMIDYFCSLYFIVTDNNFINFEQLIFAESIINLLPLIYIWIPKSEFFSDERKKPSFQELSNIENENNNSNNINSNKGKDESINIREKENEKEKIAKNIREQYALHEDEDMNIIDNINETLNLPKYKSYREYEH